MDSAVDDYKQGTLKEVDVISKRRREAEDYKSRLNETEKTLGQVSRELAQLNARPTDFTKKIDDLEDKLMKTSVRLEITEDLLFRVLAIRKYARVGSVEQESFGDRD